MLKLVPTAPEDITIPPSPREWPAIDRAVLEAVGLHTYERPVVVSRPTQKMETAR